MTANQTTFLNVAPARAYPAIAEMPESERPAYRLRHLGTGALATGELIAIQIGSPDALGIANRLLAEYGAFYHIARAPLAELEAIPGIGPTTAARLHATAALARRAAEDHAELPQIRSPADAANLLMPEMQELEREEMRVMLLDTKNRVQSCHTLYIGSLNSTLIRIGEIYHEPVRQFSNAIVVLHNHPSGDPAPSPEDVAITKQIVQAGTLLDIECLDHIIIGHQRFVSMKERGLGF